MHTTNINTLHRPITNPAIMTTIQMRAAGNWRITGSDFKNRSIELLDADNLVVIAIKVDIPRIIPLPPAQKRTRASAFSVNASLHNKSRPQKPIKLAIICISCLSGLIQRYSSTAPKSTSAPRTPKVLRWLFFSNTTFLSANIIIISHCKLYIIIYIFVKYFPRT